MKIKTLHYAKKCFKKGQYQNAIKILEPQVFSYRDDFDFYYILGMSCLYIKDFSGAQSYLRRALQISPGELSIMLGLAVVHLRRSQTSESIRIWLDVLDKDPKNIYAKKALKLVKKADAFEKVPENFLENNLYKLVPYKKGVLVQKITKTFVIAAVFSFVVAGVIFLGVPFVKNMAKVEDPYPQLVISRNLEDVIGTTEGEAVIELSGREIVKTFEDAKSLFFENKDNLARIEVNRLLFSNASVDVKEKTTLLDSYLTEPDFRHFENIIEYRDLIEKPYLYNNCYVLWTGKITNIRVFETSVSFDFLVGYETGKVLQGIINVNADFPADLDEEFTYDILAQIVVAPERDVIELEAVTLRNYIE